MKTKTIINICIWIIVLTIICFFLFMFFKRDTEVYFHNKIKAKQIIKNPYTSSPYNYPKPQVIPRKLFQMWHSKELPPKMQENVESLKKKNPELEYFLYDDKECANFIKTHFSENVLKAYNKLLPAAYKADLWRYCVMYIHGGVYLDIKYKCVDGFKFVDIMDREHFVLDTDPGNWKPGTYGIYNAFIIAKPGNPSFLKYIQSIVHHTQINYYGYNPLYPTGPGLLGELYFGNILDNISDNIRKLDDFDLVHDNINKTAFVIYKNQIILQEYPEYRMEQKAKQNHKHYGELWKERAIYSF